MEKNTDQMLGAHGEAINTLKSDVRDMRTTMDARFDTIEGAIGRIEQRLAHARGGAKMLTMLIGFATAVAAGTIELVHWVIHR